MVVEEYNRLRKQIKNSTVDYNAFSVQIQKLDSELEDHEINKLFQEAMEQEDSKNDKVSAEAVCVIIIRYRLGGYGVGIFDEAAIDSLIPKTRGSERSFSPVRE